MNKNLVSKINGYIANIGVSFVKMHNLHWNIVGSQFKAVHEYLESVYDDYADILDEAAELLRMKEGTSVLWRPASMPTWWPLTVIRWRTSP